RVDVGVDRGGVGQAEPFRTRAGLLELRDHVAQVTAGATAIPRVATRAERASLEAPARVWIRARADRLANPLDELVDVHARRRRSPRIFSSTIRRNSSGS